MKNIFLALMVAFVLIGCATEDKIDSSKDINLSKNSSSNRDIKLYFSDSMSSENSIIQPYSDWYSSTSTQATTLKGEGDSERRLIVVIKLNAIAEHKQFWIFTE